MIMPIYGKGRKGKAVKVGVISGRGQGRVVRNRTQTESYLRLHANLADLRKVFHKVFVDSDFISRCFEEKKKPVVVVDWGCGYGYAIDELGKHYGANVDAIGFGKDAYSQWGAVENARLIHASADDFNRYFKDSSIDLLYSKNALEHLISRLKKHSGYSPYPESVSLVEGLVSKLAPGGKLAFTIDLYPGLKNYPPLLTGLKVALHDKAEVEKFNNVIYITRKK